MEKKKDGEKVGGTYDYIRLLGLEGTWLDWMPAGSVSDSAPLLFQLTLGRHVLGEGASARQVRAHTNTPKLRALRPLCA